MKKFLNKYKLTALFLILLGVVVVLLASNIIVWQKAQREKPLDPKDNDQAKEVELPKVDPIDVKLDTDAKVENTRVLKFKPNLSDKEKQDYIESIGGVVTGEIDELNTVIVTIKDGTNENITNDKVLAADENDYYAIALGSDGSTGTVLTQEQIEKDAYYDQLAPQSAQNDQNGNPIVEPPLYNDTDYSKQWGIKMTGIVDKIASVDSNYAATTVAVIDSGICLENSELQGKVVAGYDFIEKDNTPQDELNHGCAVAGLIAAIGNNSKGIAGAAPKVKIMPLKVVDNAGAAKYSNVASAIIYAADHGAKIINLSVGGSNDSQLLHDAVNYALAKGVTIVAAAGNTYSTDMLYPAKYDGVISVGAVNNNLFVSDFSSHSNDVDYFAPGESIISLSKDGSTKYYSGTSFAAPYVTSLIADGYLKASDKLDKGFVTVAADGGIVIMQVNFASQGNSSGWGTSIYSQADVNPNPIKDEASVQSSTACVTRYSQGWYSGATCYIEGIWQLVSASSNKYKIVTSGKTYNFIRSGSSGYIDDYVHVEVKYTGQYTFSIQSITVVQQNQLPKGWFESTLDTATLTMNGWAYDPDTPSVSSQVHIYIDGAAGTNAPGYSIPANIYDAGVNSSQGITGNHRFSFLIPAAYCVGTHTFYAYAIDTSNSGIHTTLGSRTVTMPAVVNFEPEPSSVVDITDGITTYGYFLPQGNNADIISQANQNISYLPHEIAEDPVNTATGALNYEAVDLEYAEISGVPFEFRRAYNSDSNYAGVLGKGWQATFDMKLVPTRRGDLVSWTVIFPDGHGETFNDPDNNYKTFNSDFVPEDSESKGILMRYPSTGGPYPFAFVYTDYQTSTQFLFRADKNDISLYGKLVRINFPNGSVVDYSYNAGKLSSAVEQKYQRKFNFTLDGSGRLTNLSDASNRQTKFDYDIDGRLYQVTNSINGVTKYQYDSEKRISTIIDPNDKLIDQFTYGPDTDPEQAGKVVARIDGNNKTTYYAYTTEGDTKVTTITDPNGNATIHRHNEKNYLVEVQKPNGDKTVYTYDEKGNRKTETLPGGRTYEFGYDDKGNRTTSKYPNGYIVTTVYNAAGKPTSITDGNGDRIKEFTYNPDNNLIQIKDSLNGLTKYEYDATTKLLNKIIDPNGNTKSYSYDSNYYLKTEKYDAINATTTYENDAVGNRTKTTDPLNNVSSTTYDGLGHKLVETDARSNTKQSSYYPDGHLKTETDQAGVVTSYSYDGNYNVTEIKVGDGKITKYEYDNNNNKVKEIEPVGNYKVTGYDVNGRVVAEQYFDKDNNLIASKSILYNPDDTKSSETDLAGNVINYEYDNLGHLKSESHLAGSTTYTKNYTYDFWGNLIEETDFEGNTYKYTYDKLDRLVNSRNPVEIAEGKEGTTYTYDASGNAIKIKDSLGQITTQRFDTKNRLEFAINPKGQNATYVYAKNDILTSQITFAGDMTTFSYDANGNMLSKKDSANHVTSYEYDARNLNTKITDANGYSTTLDYDQYKNNTSIKNELGFTKVFTYDGNGNVITAKDEEGNAIKYEYDGLDRKISEKQNKEVDGTIKEVVETYTYDGNGNMKSHTDANGNTTSYSYDLFNRNTQITDPNDKSKTFTYSGNGNLLSSTDENGAETKYEYDKLNRKTKVTDPENYSTIYAYDILGRVTQETDAKNQATKYEYDELGNVLKIIDRAGNTTTNEYNGRKQITKTTYPNGLVLTNLYDIIGLMYYQSKTGTGISTPVVNEYKYDKVGNLITQTDANGNTTTNTYDKIYRVINVSKPLSVSTAKTYDKTGNIISETDENGKVTQYSYDAAGSMTKKIDANGIATSYKYDAEGNMKESIDGNGNATKYAYDKLNRKTLTQGPGDVQLEKVEYDAAGNAVKKYDGNNNLTGYDYYKNGRIKEVTDAMKNKVTYEYDGNGNVTKQTNQLGKSVQYTYSNLDKPIQKIDEGGYTWKYSYDTAGNLLTITDPKNRITTYTFDLLNQKTKMSQDGGTTLGTVETSYQYDKNGNLTKTIDPLGHGIANQYNALNRIIKTSDDSGATNEFTYDGVGNVLETKDANGNITKYSYDNVNQKISNTDPEGNKTTYDYDNNGNLLTVTKARGNKESYKYNALNQVSEYIDGENNTTKYTYDNNGNKLTEKKPNGTTMSYAFNALNLNTSISAVPATGDAVTQAQMGYDALGRVTETTDAENNKTVYSYDDLGKLTQVSDAMSGKTKYAYDEVGNILSETNANNAVTKYTYDNLDNLLTETNALNNTWTYVYDKNGNITKETDAAGVSNTRAYDINNRLLSKIYLDSKGKALPESTYFEYDKAGNLTKAYKFKSDLKTIDVTNSFTYDKNNNIISTSDNRAYNQTYSYDQNGNISTLTFTDGKQEKYTYNNNDQVRTLTASYTGNVLTAVTPKTLSTFFSYDSNGNLTDQLNPDNTVTSTKYNSFDQVVEVNNYMASSTSGVSQPILQAAVQNNLTDNTTESDEFVFDGEEFDYSYSAPSTSAALNNRTASSDPAWKTVDYVIAKYNYTLNKNGEKVKTDFSSNCDKTNKCASSINVSTSDTYIYDALGRVSKASHTINSGATIEKRSYVDSYTYDAVGNRTQLITNQSGTNLTLKSTFNANNQLLTQGDWKYTYDKNGNRLTEKNAKTTESVAFTYDKAGTQTKVTSKLKNEGGTLQDYKVTYRYDALGRRITKTKDSTVTNPAYASITKQNYIYQGKGWDMNSEYTDRTSGTDVHTNYYMADLGNATPALIFTEDVQQRSAKLASSWTKVKDITSANPSQNFIVTPDSIQKFAYYQRDELDSIVSKTNLEVRYKASNATGKYIINPELNILKLANVYNQNRTDEYGKRLNSTQTAAKTGAATDNWSTRGYSGQVYDTESATYYYGSRNYDAMTGTWTKADSYRGEYKNPLSRNRYIFVNDDPVNEVDVYGYWGLKKFIKNNYNSAKDKASSTYNSVKNTATTVYNTGKAVAQSGVSAVKSGANALSGCAKDPKKCAKKVETAVKKTVTTVKQKAKAEVKKQIDKIKKSPVVKKTVKIVKETNQQLGKATKQVKGIIQNPPSADEIAKTIKEIGAMGVNNIEMGWRKDIDFIRNMGSAIYNDPKGAVTGLYGFSLKMARDSGNVVLGGINLYYDASTKYPSPFVRLLGMENGTERSTFWDQVIRDTGTEWNKAFNKQIGDLGIVPDQNAGGGFNNVCYVTEGLCNMMADGIDGNKPSGAQATYNMAHGALELAMIYDLAKTGSGVFKGIDAGAEIKGYTKHGYEQMMGRDGGIGVDQAAMWDAVKNPQKVIFQQNGTIRYEGKNATVVLNGDKQVVTTWSNNSTGTRKGGK